MPSLVRFHQPKKTILWAFESLVNLKFMKILKIFHDALPPSATRGEILQNPLVGYKHYFQSF